MDGNLRPATPADAPAVRRIYAPYVRETAVTFTTTVPSVEAL
jgi:phosphinothricin acetyltransferase